MRRSKMLKKLHRFEAIERPGPRAPLREVERCERRVLEVRRPTAQDASHDLERDLRQLEAFAASPDPRALQPALAVQASVYWPIALRRARWAEQEVCRLGERIAELEAAVAALEQLEHPKVVELEAARQNRRRQRRRSGTNG